MSDFYEQSEAMLPSVEHEFIPQSTAWQSMPGAVRFAVWLWAVTVIVGFVAGVGFGVAFALGVAW